MNGIPPHNLLSQAGTSQDVINAKKILINEYERKQLNRWQSNLPRCDQSLNLN